MAAAIGPCKGSMRTLGWPAIHALNVLRYPL